MKAMLPVARLIMIAVVIARGEARAAVFATVDREAGRAA